MFATTGILGAYVGYPGLRRANAAEVNCTVTLDTDTLPNGAPGELRDCLNDMHTNFGSITFNANIGGTIYLNGDLPAITLASSLTITGAGQGSTVIDGASAHAAFYVGGAALTVSSLTIQNTSDNGQYSAIVLYTPHTLTLNNVTLNTNVSYYGAARSGGDVDVTDSTFTGNEAEAYSGGAINAYGYATITGSTFTGNIAAKRGGAVYAKKGIDVSDSTFTSNTADDVGGALFASENSIDITDSTFTGNSAENGGAVYADSQDSGVTATGSTFASNEAYSSAGANNGGAIRSYSDLSVTSSTFTGNVAGKVNSAYGRGGALYVYNGALTITYSTFQGNSTQDNSTSGSNGGAVATRDYYSLGQTHSITHSSFTENSATKGGAVFTYDADLNVENSTFTANSAGEGSAIYTNNGGSSLDFVTVTANSALSAGSAAIYDFDDGSTLAISNSIVYNNVDSSTDVYDVKADADLSLTYSLLTSNSSFSATGTLTTSDLIYGDPLLGALANNGGPTYTMMPAATSPVIGLADPSGAPATDQRGFTRTTNGLADMGSVEVGGAAPEPDLSQMPPAWFQAQQRKEQAAVCPPGMHASWAEWPNERTGGWTCEWSTWWDVNKGTAGGWVTTPGLNPGLRVSD